MGRGQWTASRRDRPGTDKAVSRPPPGGFGILEMRNMDILADYREWAASREEPVGTHSGRCHLWHERCMIVRLARELERTRAENADYRREVREQRREIAGLREERAMLLGADRTPGADATPGVG